MAESIVGGLFGLTPEMYQQDQRQRERAEALRFAQLEPIDRAAYGMYQAGQQLGRGVGSLLGVEDPQLKMIAQQQQILRNVDFSNPESIAEGARTASGMGNAAFAAALAREASTLSAKQASTLKDIAAATREKQTAIPTNIQEAQYVATLRNNRNQIAALPDSEEKTAALSNIDAQLSQLVKPEKPESRSELQKLLDELGSLDPVKDKQRYDSLQGRITILTTRGPKQSLSVTMPAQEKEFEKELGKGQAKGILESKEIAETSSISLQTMSEAKKILSQPIFTGPTADFQAQFGSLLQSAGVKLDTDSVANTQAYGALMAKQTAAIIKSFGAGTGLSDGDREYALKAAGGNVRMDKDSLKRIIDINERAATNSIILHNKKVKGIKTNIPLEVQLPSTGWRIVK
jgi:hypothetical protein